MSKERRPLRESLKQGLEEALVRLSPKSETTKAVRYSLKLWNALMRYVDDGRLEIGNNAAERKLRVRLEEGELSRAGLAVSAAGDGRQNIANSPKK